MLRMHGRIHHSHGAPLASRTGYKSSPRLRTPAEPVASGMWGTCGKPHSANADSDRLCDEAEHPEKMMAGDSVNRLRTGAAGQEHSTSSIVANSIAFFFAIGVEYIATRARAACITTARARFP